MQGEPDTDLSLSFAGSPWDVVILSVGMAFLVFLLWLVYRTMEVPRLPVNRSEDRAPNANWAGVLRYAVTTPIMVGFWLLVFLTLLSVAAQSRTGTDVLVATVAVIGGARLLAHLKKDMAHELAKTVPIAILGFIIIGSGFADLTQTDNVLAELLQQEDQIDTYWLSLIVFDVFLTVIWFGVIRWRWIREQRRAADGRPVEGFFGRLGDRLRGIGYDKDVTG